MYYSYKMTHFSSLGNCIFHYSGNVGDGEIDVLFPEVIFASIPILMVIESLFTVILK